MKSLRTVEDSSWNRFNELNPDQLHLVEVNEFLPHLGKWTNFGGGILLTIFVAGVSLTSVLNYNVTVKVPASIRPVGEQRIVQSAMNGIIQKIDVQENQVVTKGQAIAYVDDSQLQTQKSQLESSIQQSQLQLNQIDAQLGEMNVQIAAQTNLINRTIMAAQAEFGGIQRNYQDQQIKATADMTKAESALTLAKVQKERLLREKVLIATVQEAEAALKLTRLQRERLQPIVASGAVPRNLFEEKEQAVKSAEAKLEEAKASAKNLMEEKEYAFKVAQTDLEKARTAINPSNAVVTVASERIKQEQAKGEATLAALNKERETLLQQRLELQKQLDRSGQELQQVKTDLNKSVIRSPIAGTLLQLHLRNPGQVVQPSEAIAQIAPLKAPLLIKTRVQAQDIDKVKAGQKVQMQVSACPYPDYGTLQGIVETVAPDALPTLKNNVDQNVAQVLAYQVTIQPQKPYLGRGDRQCHLKSGMEGRADIISRQETVLHFILRKARLITDF
ncbi:HlyD family efflux transporter periplasmic adaptor subunit [Nostoc edaphicum CCNP1411]|uniref:HlyD family efflux transporter periplasmic adaptor subunit n=1 Tax=Nostoc edaphicum CCNP1411 TaxID=1472755 RepID=A0A7D7LG97_9NOSO|nr:HlyD family efflux transporter periplasmic adaptor subunit [Nostoc edaphicum]QMS89932.1 HlyD family efflux transporter periplasmic adaptor subunit [Nostoc edaphicum CCNP1411]